MNDDEREHHPEDQPALTPLGIPPEETPDPDVIAIGPEMAVAEGDVRWPEGDELITGRSLWRDAWRRLLKNKLAVFGLIVVIVITIASITGPWLIHKTLGFTPDYIPSNDVRLIKSFPPFTNPDGRFSWT